VPNRPTVPVSMLGGTLGILCSEDPRREIAVERSPEPEPPTTFIASVRALPQPGRWAAIGAISVGIIGAISGLIIGLFVHPPTALFALVEIGLPAAVIGGFIGFVLGSFVAVVRRAFRNGPQDF
jgi:hypothetical protein